MRILNSLLTAVLLASLCALLTGPAFADALLAGSAVPARVQVVAARGKIVPLDDLGGRKITIDGDLSDWGNLAEDGTPIDQMLDHTEGDDSPARTDATVFKLLRGPDALYLAIAVADPDRVIAGPNSPYSGDAIELFLDVRPVAPLSGPKLGDQAYTDGGVYQVVFTAPTANNQPVVWRQFTGVGPKFGPIDVAERNETWGYTLEMRIPFSSLNNSPASRFNDPIGFDLYVDDLDPGKGHSVYAWGGMASDWFNADQFGLAMPGYHRDLPSPFLRAVPARYAGPPNPGACAGTITTIGGPSSTDSMQIHLRRVGSSDKTDYLKAISTQVVDHPELGVTVTRQRASIRDLKFGAYQLTTQIAGLPLLDASQTFQTLSYHSAPTPDQVKAAGASKRADRREGTRFVLPNGWAISPAGDQIPLAGDMPMRLVLSPDGKYLFVNTAGYNQHGVSAVDLATNKVVDNIDLQDTWYGMALDAAGTGLIVSGGGVRASKAADATPGMCPRALAQVSWADGRFKQGVPISLPGGDGGMSYVSGIVSAKDGSIYAADMNEDTVYHLAPGTGAVLAANKVYYRPYALALSPDGKMIAVSNWGDGTVSFLDAANLKLSASIAVGSHPNDLVYAPDGRLFVANGGSNSVSVVANGSLIETITTSIDPKAPIGSTPDALAIAPGGKCLYVANADNNDVAVVDISNPGESVIRGFIPTGWYPSALAVSPDGRKIFVGVGKGLRFGDTANGVYIGRLLNGAVSVVPAPTPTQLAEYTKEVIANTPLPQTTPSTAAQKAVVAGAFQKIKHIVYIIRENRTYDQVLGDMDRGDGDPGITMFGKEVTPNAHSLASHYVLLDNLYCNGEVSEDGHEWCNAAYATDFKERAWVGTYSGRGEPDADDRLSASPAGYLWDNCAKHGTSYISYGEYGGYNASPNSPPAYYGVPGLAGHASKTFSQLPWGKVHDTARADIFIKDMHAAEQTGKWPSYMVMALGEDHTQGLTPKAYTPVAAVAANDQAIGMIVDAVSHSRFWKQTAIFIIEDDAQNGADHVDAHRTVGLVISPYVKRNTVDHTFYTTSSFVHTMEMILGLPVMTQYDGAASPMYNAFTTQPDFSPIGRCKPLVDIDAINGDKGPGALISSKLDFSAPDRADPDILNKLLWTALKPGLPQPPPVRSARLNW